MLNEIALCFQYVYDFCVRQFKTGFCQNTQNKSHHLIFVDLKYVHSSPPKVWTAVAAAGYIGSPPHFRLLCTSSTPKIIAATNRKSSRLDCDIMVLVIKMNLLPFIPEKYKRGFYRRMLLSVTVEIHRQLGATKEPVCLIRLGSVCSVRFCYEQNNGNIRISEGPAEYLNIPIHYRWIEEGVFIVPCRSVPCRNLGDGPSHR